MCCDLDLSRTLASQQHENSVEVRGQAHVDLSFARTVVIDVNLPYVIEQDILG